MELLGTCRRRSLAHGHAVTQLVIAQDDDLERGIESARNFGQFVRLNAGRHLDAFGVPVRDLKYVAALGVVEDGVPRYDPAVMLGEDDHYQDQFPGDELAGLRHIDPGNRSV